ncbi:unnamed protein product, partial [Amoebophrya sp. A120]
NGNAPGTRGATSSSDIRLQQTNRVHRRKQNYQFDHNLSNAGAGKIVQHIYGTQYYNSNTSGGGVAAHLQVHGHGAMNYNLGTNLNINPSDREEEKALNSLQEVKRRLQRERAAQMDLRIELKTARSEIAVLRNNLLYHQHVQGESPTKLTAKQERDIQKEVLMREDPSPGADAVMAKSTAGSRSPTGRGGTKRKQRPLSG